MKKFLIILLSIAIIYCAFYFTKDYLISNFVNRAITKFLGVQVEISGYSWDIVNSAVRIKDCRIYNPESFPKGLLVDIQDINCEYDLTLLLRKELHLTIFELSLKELIVIKDKNGKFNIDALNFVQRQQIEQKPMHIDVLKLNVDKVIYKDYSLGDKPLIQLRHVNVRNTYKNINSAEQLSLLIFSDALKSMAITGLKIYGLAVITGVYFLPVEAVVILTDKDSVSADFNMIYASAYKISLEVVDELGDVVKQDISKGIIRGKVHGVDVGVRILQKQDAVLNISVSARSFLFPKPAIAEGVLYEITGKITDKQKTAELQDR